MTQQRQYWYSVRCVFRLPEHGAFEERITLWRARSFEEAIAKAENEAVEYATVLELEFSGLSQCYQLDAGLGEGAEIFSLVRQSDLQTGAYLSAFFDTGTEFQSR